MYPSDARREGDAKELTYILGRGARLMSLSISLKMASGGLGLLTIPSLVELEISMISADLFWLPQFIIRHPNLRKITFLDRNGGVELPRAPNTPFIDRFFEAAVTDLPPNAVTPIQFTIERELGGVLTSNPPFDNWKVTALLLRVRSAIIQVVGLASRIFPSINFLTLTMETSDVNHMVSSPFLPFFFSTNRPQLHQDTFIDCLKMFPSLRILSLPSILPHLDFSGKMPTQRLPSPKLSEAFTAEAALQWFGLRMASALPSLDAIYFEEEGYELEDTRKMEEWRLVGWYRVQQRLLMNGGGNELVGTLSIWPPWKRSGNLIHMYEVESE